MEDNLDAVAFAREVFVHGVVNNFPDEVVQPAGVGAADVHRGAFPDRLQPFEDLDIFRGVGLFESATAMVVPEQSAGVRGGSPCLVISRGRTSVASPVF